MLSNSANNMLISIPLKTSQFLSTITWPVMVGSMLISMFAPIKTIVHVIIVFLVIDAITSIYAQYKTRIRSKNLEETNICFKSLMLFRTFSSSKARITVEKLIFYILAISSVFLFETFLLHRGVDTDMQVHPLSVTNLAAILVTIVELGSIMANISKITNNKAFIQIYKMLVSNVKKTHGINQQPNSKDK